MGVVAVLGGLERVRGTWAKAELEGRASMP